MAELVPPPPRFALRRGRPRLRATGAAGFGGVLMDPRLPEVAHRIVADYAGLLETQTQREIYPALLTDLPYPKETIKTAIQTSVAALAATDQLTTELRDFLEVAYVSLADYIDDELARLLREYRQAGEALEHDGRQSREKIGSPAWNLIADSSQLAGTIARAIAIETEQLRREFHEFTTPYSSATPD
jgi:hypothetical protein